MGHASQRNVAVIVLSTLSAFGGPGSAGPGPAAGGESSAGGAGSLPIPERDARELFEASALEAFELSLPPERWQYLQAHARDEEYEPAELRFRGEVVGRVGLRFKGSVGTLRNCFDAQGNLTCRKLSMKLKFDAYDPDLRFFGLKRLNLHAMIHDATLVHEKLTYELYREMGIVAPRSSWALANVNGASLGLFSLVEEIDGRFTKDRWADGGNGNLYKEAWPDSTDPADYAGAIETNEDTAKHEAFATFADDLNRASDPSSRRSALGKWMDLDQLARYMAVDDAIANIDGVTAIYCDPSDKTACGNHNYFFYLSEDQARFTLVPWDLDATLWPQTVYDNVPPWQVTPEACDARYALDHDETNLAAPGCDPLFQGLAHDLTAYDRAFEELVAGPFSVAVATAAIDRHAAFIADAVAVEPNGQTVERWRSELAMLKSNIPRLHARARARRSGFTASDLDLSTTAENDFEKLVPELTALLPALSNAASTARVELTAPGSPPAALQGEKSLVLAFEYRNEGTVPWGQWTNLALPFQGRPADLSTPTGLRLTLRTDRARTVRIDLDSRLYEASVEGIKFGWDVPATDAPQTVELPFASAALPSWARATTDDFAAIRASVDALAFHPICNDRDDTGFLAEGVTDAGFLEIDAIAVY